MKTYKTRKILAMFDYKAYCLIAVVTIINNNRKEINMKAVLREQRLCNCAMKSDIELHAQVQVVQSHFVSRKFYA